MLRGISITTSLSSVMRNSHEDSMVAFMQTVFPRMARVRSTDQVLEMIRKG